MKEKSNLIMVYTGSEISVNLLKEELEIAGVFSIIQNDFNSGVTSGFSGGIPSTIDIFIQKVDLLIAEPIILSFKELYK